MSERAADESDVGATVESLMDEVAGQWLISTASGSKYYVDLDLMLFSRIALTRAENELAAPLRRDGEPVAILEIRECTVGKRGIFLIDLQWPLVAMTLRQTTEIVSIEAQCWDG